MLSKKEAINRALKYLLDEESDEDLGLIESSTIEKPFGWVFFYNSKKFLESGSFRDQLAGNAPFIINKYNGELYVMGTAYEVEHYIEEYENLNNKIRE